MDKIKDFYMNLGTRGRELEYLVFLCSLFTFSLMLGLISIGYTLFIWGFLISTISWVKFRNRNS